MTTRLRDTTALGVGAALSGVLAYVFFALVTQVLGPVSAAPVSVLWAYWSFAGAALTFPLQHWVSRSVPAHDGERSVRDALPGVALVSVGLAVLAGGAAWLARDLLFHSGQPWFPALVGAVTLGAAVMGLVRGVLAARRRFRAVAVGLVAENVVRCAAAALLVVAGVRDPVAYGLCLVAGYAAVLAWPSSFRLGRTGRPRGDESPLTFLGGAGGGQVIGQAVLTGGPVVLALAGGSARDITALFAGLALFRAPYIVALGLVSQLTGRFTTLVVRGRRDVLRRIRLWLAGLTAAAAAAAALVGAVAGPPLLRLVFGPDVTLPGHLTAVLAVGSTVAMANLVTTLVVLAHGRTPALIRAWALALAPGAVWFLAADLPALERTSWAFLVVEAAAFGLLLREEARGTSRLV